MHFPSPLPLQIKGVSADLLNARCFKRCTPLTIYQIQCILQHLLHSTYIFIWKLEKLVKCTLNALVRLTYSRYINVRVLENVIFTRIDGHYTLSHQDLKSVYCTTGEAKIYQFCFIFRFWI